MKRKGVLILFGIMFIIFFIDIIDNNLDNEEEKVIDGYKRIKIESIELKKAN